MRFSGPSRAFKDFVARPPARWQKVVAAVLVPWGLWDKRGAVVGVVELVVYGGVVLGAAFHHGRVRDWSRRHMALDALLVVPMGFLALAYLTDLKLGVCFLLALALGVALVPVTVRRRNDGAAG